MIPRLYIEAPLTTGAAIVLSKDQAHYLKNVLRRDAGDGVCLFNGRDGEFSAKIAELKKKGGVAAVGVQTRAPEQEPDLVLYFAPVKRGAIEMIVQKATEIGVARLRPVITARTIATKLNIGRLQSIAIEAAEQCGRLSIPSVDEPIMLDALFKNRPEGGRLIFCDEAGDNAEEEWGGRDGRAQPALDVLKQGDSKAYAPAVFIGPEGGFSPAERAALRGLEFVTPVTLGPRILRADTAAIAALVLLQATYGDWRRP